MLRGSGYAVLQEEWLRNPERGSDHAMLQWGSGVGGGGGCGVLT